MCFLFFHLLDRDLRHVTTGYVLVLRRKGSNTLQLEVLKQRFNQHLSGLIKVQLILPYGRRLIKGHLVSPTRYIAIKKKVELQACPHNVMSSMGLGKTPLYFGTLIGVLMPRSSQLLFRLQMTVPRLCCLKHLSSTSL